MKRKKTIGPLNEKPRNFVHKYNLMINTARTHLDQKKEEKSNPNRKHKNKRFDE